MQEQQAQHTLHHLSTLSTLLWLSPLVINSFASNRSVDLCPFTVPLIDCSIDGRTTAAHVYARMCMCVCVCWAFAYGPWPICLLLPTHLHLIAKIFSRLGNFYGSPKVNDKRSSIATANIFQAQIPVKRRGRRVGEGAGSSSPVELMSCEGKWNRRAGRAKFLLLDW